MVRNTISLPPCYGRAAESFAVWDELFPGGCSTGRRLIPSGLILNPELTDPPAGLADAARFRTT
jgi:hypothetical protein